MAGAKIKLPDGTDIEVKGSAEEIAKIMRLYQPASEPARPERTITSSKKRSAKPGGKAPPKGPTGYISQLKAEDFFSKKRTLPEIQKKLEEKGHIYSQMALSTPVLRLVRQKVLRRLKEGGIWCYVNQ